jgi:hypothetical protein
MKIFQNQTYNTIWFWINQCRIRRFLKCPLIFDLYSQKTGTPQQAPVFLIDQYIPDKKSDVFIQKYALF